MTQNQRPPDHQKKTTEEEEEEITKELCTINGINYSRLLQEGMATLQLEIFFSGYPRMLGLPHFPNLLSLVIVGQTVSRIEGLEAVPQLRELWVVECKLRKIDGLKHVKHLQKLYLYSNEISRIENLDHLEELEVLWLHGNRITDIEGLSELGRLKELNLAENRIEKIGNSLSSLTSLEILELSGNQMCSFRDLTNLVRLEGLVELGLKSPMYAPAPVSELCNYQTHLLYHLPNIKRLDTYDVTTRQLKEHSEMTVVKKKMYYNMKVKTLRRNLGELLSRLNGARIHLVTIPCDRLRHLVVALKGIERELKIGDNEEANSQDGQEKADKKDDNEKKAAHDPKRHAALVNKMKAIKDRIKKWERKTAEIDHFWQEGCEKMRQVTETTIQRLVIELETGGNVRFENGKPSDIWFTSCHDLLLSRFCAGDYQDHGIIGVKIHRITRIHNRILKSKFEDSLSALIDDEDIYNPAASAQRMAGLKKHLEYLFFVWDPTLPGGVTEMARIPDEGFRDAETYKKLGRDGAVPLANSLSLADKLRMAHCSKHAKGKEHGDVCPFRHGQVIIAKIYVGKSSMHSSGKTVTRATFPKSDTVYRPRKDIKQHPVPPPDEDLGTAGMQVPAKPCECRNRQSEWFVFNHDLVLPEYIVDFEYISRVKPRSPFSEYTEALLQTKDVVAMPTLDDVTPDEDVLTMEPEIQARPNVSQLTEEAILRAAKAPSLSHIRVLDLHGLGLTKLRHLHGLTHLRKLVVSANDLSRLEDIGQMNIEHLDASFNKLVSLDTIRNMPKLMFLDVSWNQLYNTRDEISTLRKHTPALTTVDLRHNNWQKPDGLRLRVIGRIKTLTWVNGGPVTEAEATAALRVAAGSRVSQVSLLAHSRTDLAPPRTLNLAFYAQVLIQSSRNKPDRVGEQDNLWYSKVTTLNLDGQHITKISNLDRLENLRWASFNDNDITKIEGLENCLQLEELSLEHNCITKLEGIAKLGRLKRLALGHNYLTSLEDCGLERLPSLTFLSLENNQIPSLAGLQRLNTLVELYVGNNAITNIREVFYLKQLPNLVILDLYGNPVATSVDNYRLFIIFHLRSLKALDGTAIEMAESMQAKDTFGGRLTSDFVAERLGHGNFNEIKELDFPHCGIRTVDIGNGDTFLNLRSVNLEHNNLTSLSGLIFLVNLRVLCLNHNHIECIVPKPKQLPPSLRRSYNERVAGATGIDPYNPDSYTPILENLEVLHLGYNNIKDMATLQLSRLTSLKALFLQGNEITKVEGLEGLQDLRELVLDRNKIKSISEYSFCNQWNLQELHIEENRLRDMAHLACLENLQRLFLGMNRIQDMAELERLEALPNLVELSVVSNAVARRLLHRPMLVYRMPQLLVIDGIPVSEEERTKAELYFMEQQPQQTTVETTLPGIGQYKTQVPVKVTNMQLLSGPFVDKTFGGTLHLSEDIYQQEIQKAFLNLPQGGGRRRPSNNYRDPMSGGSTINAGSGGRLGNLPYQTGGAGGGNNSRSQHQVPYMPYQGAPSDTYNTSDLNRINKNNRR